DEFLGGFGLKPPQSTLFCVRSPGEDLESPGAVLDIAGRGGGDMVASCRQMSPEKANHFVEESLSVARRE
ncbi:hypothetical protein A2U01_0087947, partial [Trifolium medium]|nr:hypothetical protein [Trifolium medium]